MLVYVNLRRVILAADVYDFYTPALLVSLRYNHR